MLLYKYFPADTKEQIDRLLKMLQGLVYFSSPIKFNDPFELRPTLRFTTKIGIQSISPHFTNKSLGVSKTQERKIASAVLSSIRRKGGPAFVEKWISDIGVLYLTEDPKSLLMWSHYGASHRGVCIGINTLSAGIGSFQKVCYQSVRPEIVLGDSYSDHEELKRKILFTKSDHWSYEKEWRSVKRPVTNDEKQYYQSRLDKHEVTEDEVAQILVSAGGSGLYEIDQNSIERIYFGCKVNPDASEKIRLAASAQCKNIKFINLSTDQRQYRLIESRR